MNLLSVISPFVRAVDHVTYNAFWVLLMLAIMGLLCLIASEVLNHPLSDKAVSVYYRILIALMAAAALCMIIGVTNHTLFYP